MSKAREALERMSHMNYMNGEFKAFQCDLYYSDKIKLDELVTRDEPKEVIHENTFKSFGKCPVCNSSVAIQFHSVFCGKCGNRLKWRREEK